MYKFRLYYYVNGANRRRGRDILVPAHYDLADAWKEALRCAIAHTKDDEILYSLKFIEREEQC